MALSFAMGSLRAGIGCFDKKLDDFVDGHPVAKGLTIAGEGDPDGVILGVGVGIGVGTDSVGPDSSRDGV
jgi:hypothetical protein